MIQGHPLSAGCNVLGAVDSLSIRNDRNVYAQELGVVRRF